MVVVALAANGIHGPEEPLPLMLISVTPESASVMPEV
jgi:hypothetical protein